jgi:uncharacterized protein YqiB (DUF1249 family)
LFDVCGGVIKGVKLYSDALNSGFIEALENALKGVRYGAEYIYSAVNGLDYAEKEEILVILPNWFNLLIHKRDKSYIFIIAAYFNSVRSFCYDIFKPI